MFDPDFYNFCNFVCKAAPLLIQPVNSHPLPSRQATFDCHRLFLLVVWRMCHAKLFCCYCDIFWNMILTRGQITQLKHVITWTWFVFSRFCKEYIVDFAFEIRSLARYLYFWWNVKVSATLRDRFRADRSSFCWFCEKPYKLYIFWQLNNSKKMTLYSKRGRSLTCSENGKVLSHMHVFID